MDATRAHGGLNPRGAWSRRHAAGRLGQSDGTLEPKILIEPDFAPVQAGGGVVQIDRR